MGATMPEATPATRRNGRVCAPRMLSAGTMQLECCDSRGAQAPSPAVSGALATDTVLASAHHLVSHHQGNVPGEAPATTVAGRRWPLHRGHGNRASNRIEVGVGDALPVRSGPLPDTQARGESGREQLASDHLGRTQPEADDEIAPRLGDLEILETDFAEIHLFHQLHRFGAIA